MINNNKILTVSYGTFSCTLEGFDDSFGTMKAIAEYFRDLASEDRYFGAEPPQPDAEMLAHIAQKEISRRVEARQQDGKIVLSAHSGDAAPAPTPKIAASNQAGPSVVSTSFAPRRPNEISAYYDAYRLNSLKALAPEEAKQHSTTPQDEIAPSAPVTDSVAQVTAPKAAEVDDAVVTEVQEVEAPAAKVASKAEETPLDFEVDQAPSEEIDLSEIDIVPGQPDEEIEAFFAESKSANSAEDASAEDLDVEDAAPVSGRESIAAKLQRIRAVVSRQESEATKTDYTEDEHVEEDKASPDAAAKEAFVAEAVHEIEEAFEADDAVETAEVEDLSDDNQDDDVNDMLSRLDADDDAEAEDDSVETTAAVDYEADDDLVETTVSLDDDADDIDQSEESISEDLAEVAASAAPLGRAIKVKRADLDLAIAKGDLEEYATEDAETASSDITPQDEASETAETEKETHENRAPSTLSDEDEDELARELAEVEAASDRKIDESGDQPDGEVSLRRSLPSLNVDQGSDMNRLLAETDNQMDDPESAKRRDAITHLRAAVAAKKADVALGAMERDGEDNNAYRNDLAEVVKPRRPVSGTTRTERPLDARPAPLKLVAEQRIDTNSPISATPVRPRRVAAVAATGSSDPIAGGFAEFASEMGATKLPELLEAAAAYMSFVEGLDQFSRPQLMNTVRQVEKEEFSREEGLRSFGQLLRTGKLQKLDGGRFKASEDIGYQPDARAAG